MHLNEVPLGNWQSKADVGTTAMIDTKTSHHFYEKSDYGLASCRRAVCLKGATIRVMRVGSGCRLDIDNKHGDKHTMSRKATIRMSRASH
jgi:hypothetical protein